MQNFKQLMLEYKDLWFKPQAGRCTTMEMDVTVNGPPKRQNARPCPAHLISELHRQIDDLLEAALIENDPQCKWVAPCSLVRKPRSDKWRLVVDYRYINTLVEDDSYQLPRIDEILMHLKGMKWFSVIDLNWGFWNLRLSPRSQQYTGFAVPGRGIYKWLVTPFGLKVSPTNFQKAIEIALRKLIDEGKVKVYIDDIVIATFDLTEHLSILAEVYEALRQCGFYINFAKAKLLQREALLLGHLISYNTIKPDPTKIQALVDSVAPNNKKALLSFCAAANFLRAYIPCFSQIMAPLTDLTSKNVRFVWGEEHEEAFAQAKEALINAVYLTMPDFTKPFVIFADASEVAVAAVLAQPSDNEETMDIISCTSRKLQPAQRNWNTSERELYAIVLGCERFEMYIKGTRPIIYTDHSALLNLIGTEQPKLKRWTLRLMEFRPVIQSISGKNNLVADWLSRALPEDDEWMPNNMFVPEVFHLIHETEDFELPTMNEIAAAIEEEASTMSPNVLQWRDNAAFNAKTWKLYIPQVFRERMLLWFHASRYGGHQGITRTYSRMKRFIWWPNMHDSISHFIGSCPICLCLKSIKMNLFNMGALESIELFGLVSMDFIGPRTFIDIKYHILVMVDHYSRFMVTVLIRGTPDHLDVMSIVRDHWISKFGMPLAILTDRGSQFTAEEFQNYVVTTNKAKLFYASTAYPQGNGINESSHRILETAMMTTNVKFDTKPEDVLAQATLLYNVTPNRIIGDTPASLVFGKDLLVPGLNEITVEMTEEARLTTMRNQRGLRVLAQQLSETEECAKDFPMDRHQEFKVGDLIVYKLSDYNREKLIHFTTEIKWNPHNSFPQRVVKVTKNDLLVKPLWTLGKVKSIPIVQCRLIASFIPHLLRDKMKELYSHVNWLSAEQLRKEEALDESEEDNSAELKELVPSESPSRKRKRHK
jgi:hypothetical protein